MLSAATLSLLPKLCVRSAQFLRLHRFWKPRSDGLAFVNAGLSVPFADRSVFGIPDVRAFLRGQQFGFGMLLKVTMTPDGRALDEFFQLS